MIKREFVQSFLSLQTLLPRQPPTGDSTGTISSVHLHSGGDRLRCSGHDSAFARSNAPSTVGVRVLRECNKRAEQSSRLFFQLCRFHAAVDLSGKFFSVVILTSMSCERYLVVCTRWRYVATPARLTLIPLAFGVLFAVIIPMIPVVVFTNLYEIRLEEGGVNYTQAVCLHYMPLHFVALYVQYTFFSGFLLPFLIMAVCYICLVRHVRQKFRERTAVNRSE